MFKKITDILLFTVLKMLGIITGFLSQRIRVKTGRFLGRILRFVFSGRFIIAKENLSMAMPELNKEQIRRTAMKSFENLGINLLEILLLQSISKDKLKKLLSIKNPEFFEEMYNRGRGVILLSAHYGNWEVLAVAGNAILEKNFLLIVEQQTNRFITAKMLEIRTRFGNESVGRYSAAKSIINKIQEGGIVMIMGDQSAVPNKDVFVNFFDMPTITYKAPASLALKFDAALVLALLERQEDGSYSLEFKELKQDGMSDNMNDIHKLTQIHAKMLEQQIRKNPGDWAWMHRRWKHKPEHNNG